jgi:hypothetical protein
MTRYKSIRQCLMLLPAIAATMSCSPAIADQTVIYQSVKAENKWDEGHRRLTVVRDGADIPLFLVEGDELFLKIQATRTQWWLYVEVDQPAWNADQVRSLLKEHPDLAKLFPSPSALNGGVVWIPIYATVKTP